VKNNQNLDFHFKIHDSEDMKGIDYTIKYNDLHMSGTEFGDEKGDNSCYIPVFAHGLTKEMDKDYDKLLIVGNIFMKDYYIVYDMTPLDENGEDYI